MKNLNRSFYAAASALLGAFGFTTQASAKSFGNGVFTVMPYAAVSSTKNIKPDRKAESSTEVVNTRTTYGLGVEVKLGRLFSLGVKGGVNQLETSKKSVAMRDEYGDIDFVKDANVDPNSQTAAYKYKEVQQLGQALLSIRPQLGKYLWVKAAAGVRARQRLITITDPDGIKKEIKDPIRYSPLASAGVGANVLGAFKLSLDYSFYFLKFPKTEPHEQEVSVGFGVSI